MTGRATLYLLLAVVAGAAAMLSFAALRDLAELCGFTHGLAWLLPVVVDAGAAAGSLVWLAPTTAAEARVFARRLALGLLGLSVAANALGHGLAAFVLLPPWWVVVVLSGIAPAVLGAMVHLAVLVGRPLQRQHHPAPVGADAGADAGADQPLPLEPPATGASDPNGFPWTWDAAPVRADGPSPPRPMSAGASAEPLTLRESDTDPAPARVTQARGAPDVSAHDVGTPQDDTRVASLIAAGAGRRQLSRELGVTEYEARRLLEQARPGATAAGSSTPGTDSPSHNAGDTSWGESAADDDTATAGALDAEPVTTGAGS